MTTKAFKSLPKEAQEIIKELARVCEIACGVASKEDVSRRIASGEITAPFTINEPTSEELTALKKAALKVIGATGELYGSYAA